jgi:hypothetical protein
MAAKNSKAGPSGSASNDKKGGEKLTFQGRHTTPYPKYRRGGLVFTKAMAEYTTDRETLARLLADPPLDLKTPDDAAAAAGGGSGSSGDDGSEGGDGSGDTGGDAA